MLATAAFAEHAAGRVFDLFGKWVASDAVDVIVESADDIATLLRERAYDIALGARPALGASAGLEIVPFFKYQRVMVASSRHPLASIPGRSRWPAAVRAVVRGTGRLRAADRRGPVVRSAYRIAGSRRVDQ